MKHPHIAVLAGAFAAASTMAVLAGGLGTAPVAHGTLLGVAPVTALADPDDAANTCMNGTAKPKGWCKHANDPNYTLVCKAKKHDTDDQNCRYKKIKRHHPRHAEGMRTINGTVVSVNGNVATFRLDNGQMITVLDNNGTVLSVGQHYSLRGAYQGGQFVLGAMNANGPGSGAATSVSGNIVAVGNGTVTLLGAPPLVINVQQAVNNNATGGALSIGRHITAYGYYRANVFYATSIQ